MNAAPPLSDEREGRQHRGLLIASEVYTVLGTVPPVLGSSEVTSILTKGVGGVIGATFAVEPDPPPRQQA